MTIHEVNTKGETEMTTVAKAFRISWAVVVAGALLLLAVAPVGAAGFTHGLAIDVDGEYYYMAGAPDGPDGAFDIPGHYWVQTGPARLQGKHYNTGPFGAPQWWSSDAPDGELLYVVDARIDTWSPEKAAAYAARGFVHYHELVSVDGGELHPTKVVWLKHIARTFFTLDGGPHPELAYEAEPGVNYEFIPNASMPYNPSSE